MALATANTEWRKFYAQLNRVYLSFDNPQLYLFPPEDIRELEITEKWRQYMCCEPRKTTVSLGGKLDGSPRVLRGFSFAKNRNTMAKAKKKRVDHYDKPLKIYGTFDEVIKVAMTNPDAPKPKPIKPPKKGNRTDK
jgi:hypothetical protein